MNMCHLIMKYAMRINIIQYVWFISMCNIRPPVKGWGLQYLHHYSPKLVVNPTNGLNYEVGYGILDISH